MKQGYKPEVGAVYGVYVEELRKYGAYQILEVEQGSVCYIVLDYLETEPPKKEDLSGIRPLYLERFRYHHALNMKYIYTNRVPEDYIFIGVCAPVTNRSCKVYSGKEWGHGVEYLDEADWQEADSKQKENYKKYINSGEWVTFKKDSFRKNEGVLTTELYKAAGENFSVDQFPCVTAVHIEGANPGILDCIADASLIHTFHWQEPQTEELDFRNTRLHTFELDGTGVKRIYLPDGVRSLKLTGRLQPELQIIGETVSFTIDMETDRIFHYGLTNVKRLFLGGIKELSLEKIPVVFPELHSLTIAGEPGIIKNLDALGRMCSLRDLTVYDLFGFSADDMKVLEKLPQLRSLDLYSIPKEAGLAARKICKGKLDNLEVQRLRSDDWLKENLDNPFRHWDGSEFVPIGAYKKTMQQYKKTRKQLKQVKTREEAVEVVKEYGCCFNLLNKRYDEFIETDEREDLFSVLEQLYEEFLRDKGLIGLDDFLDILDEIREEW
ncbi:MAG: hypothetical protein HDT39_01590 [Lachnospiraceae bacterium]|nr:hypothetical protein [Lachnospiraceae bacterium]